VYFLGLLVNPHAVIFSSHLSAITFPCLHFLIENARCAARCASLVNQLAVQQSVWWWTSVLEMKIQHDLSSVFLD
jgi:hypothetical protein